ncbi:cytochrome P450 [Pseudomonas citronellolis]|jgi:cytochrome P450|uniref:Cytochrome P450 n=1 Tax=Pseudomonas citronellolis TaxID=53408 RepID=A0AAW6P9K8_9PSED|nr:cytochrome P450 [Pseudomonas citronellolis]MDF3843011.1 cytochrome P450 [Pseudomonas citronellolis]
MAFAIPAAERPEHVPVERVIDFDIYALQVDDGEYQAQIGRQLHAPGAPDIFWTPQNGGHWVTARADLIDEILADPQRFSSRRISVIDAMNPTPPFAPLQIDPPDHAQYRKLLGLAMSPVAVSALGDQARALAIELIEGFKAKGECEFIGDFAAHLPVAIFMSMVDLPTDDRPQLLEIAESLVRSDSLMDVMQGNQRLAAYTLQKITERRCKPGADLISQLLAAEVGGKPMDDLTLLGMIDLLLLAGLDTVASMMGFFARYLALNPGFRQRLTAEPESIPRAVEELLRRFPIANLARQVVDDCTLGGVSLRAGELILLPTAAFGLDERRFERPEAVELERKSKINATFGGGAHRCLGAMLARVELRIFLEEWLARIPDFHLKPGVALSVHSGAVAAIRQLPLVWEVD